MSKNKKSQLKELFIEDLGKVTGGKGPIYTTLAIGEEDSTDPGPVPTTKALGEEGPIYTTMALGEEEPGETK